MNQINDSDPIDCHPIRFVDPTGMSTGNTGHDEIGNEANLVESWGSNNYGSNGLGGIGSWDNNNLDYAQGGWGSDFGLFSTKGLLYAFLFGMVLDQRKGPVKPGQTGKYGTLKAQKKAHGETEALDMDHQPSYAAQVAAKEAELGRPLGKAELAQLKASTPAVASPRAVHQQTSPTYGGRNTPSQIAEDAANLGAAAARDRAAFNGAMKKR